MAISVVGRRVSDWIGHWPVSSSVGFALSRGAAGDGCVQWLEHKRASSDARWALDLQRTATYMGWSAISCLWFDLLLYRYAFPRAFPTWVAGRFCRANVLKATATENLFITPLIYLPGFYVFKDIVVAPRADRPATVPSALAHYGDEFWAQNGCSALFWAPMNYVTFALVPVHLRVAFVSVVAVGYVSVLSAVTQYLDQRSSDAAEKLQRRDTAAHLVRRATRI